MAEHLLDIYMEHAPPPPPPPPEILQSDQGQEFKGVVKTVCEALNVRIVKSSAYSPQTQGKDERSHRTWKEKLRFDLINIAGDLNWSEYLQYNQKLYNESAHRSLGFLSPFEVYFGRKPNRIRNKLFLGGKKEYEVLGENNSSFETGESKREELLELEIERDAIRLEALDASNEAAQYMVKRELRRNPPSLYYKGETVLIRIPISKKIVMGKKNSLKSTFEGIIIEADHTVHKYLISYNDPETRKSKRNWFKVDNVISVTKEEENETQQKAKSNNGKRTARFRDHKESIDQPAKRRTNNASLLQASINQILSREKLNGDTINLYFEFLTNTEDIKEGCNVLLSSFFESTD